MAERDQQIQEVLDAVRRLLTDSSKSAPKPRGGYKAISAAEAKLAKETKRLEEATGDLADIYEQAAKTQKTQLVKQEDTNTLVETANQEYVDTLSRAKKALRSSSVAFSALEREVEEMSHKSVPDQIEYLRNYSSSVKSLTNDLSKQARSSSMLSAAMIAGSQEIEKGSIEYQEMINDLQKAAGSLNKGLLKSLGAWDETTNSVKGGLNKNTFAGLRLVAGETEVVLNEALKGLNVGSFGDLASLEKEALEKMLSDNTETQQAVKKKTIEAIAKMANMGYDVGEGIIKNGKVDHSEIEALHSKDNMAKLAKAIENLAEIQKQNKKFSGSADSTANAANSPFAKTIYSIKGLNTSLDNAKSRGEKMGVLFRYFGKNLFAAGAAAAHFAKFKEAIKQGWQEMVSFNTEGIPASFAGVQLASMRLGMSFEETVKFMRENKNTMAIYGDGFGKLSSQLGGTFRTFGYNMKQASAIIPEAVDSAIGAGVNIRNGDALNAFIDDSMKSFSRVRGVLDVTAEQYMRLNAQLLSSADIQGSLVGLSQQQAVAYSRDLVAERDRYAVMLGSTEAANDLLKAQQRAARAGVVQRMREGAMTMVAAKQAGLSDEQAMAAMRIRAKGRTASAAEQTQLQQIYGQIGVAREQQIRNAQETGGTGAQQGVEALWERLTTGAEDQIEAGMKIYGRERSGAVATDADLARSGKAAEGSAFVAGLSQIFNQISSVLNNSFVAAVTSGTAALAALTISAFSASRSLGLMGGGSILGGAKRLGGRVLGGAAGTLARGGRAVLSGAGSLLGRGGGMLARGAGALTTGAAGTAAGVLGAGAAGYGLGTLIEKKTGIGSKIGLGLYDWLHGDEEKARQVAEEKAMQEAVARGRAARAAREAASVQPAAIRPPSVTQPGQSTTEEAVNNLSGTTSSDESGNKSMTVQDMTAHDYLSSIADNMVQAVKLLQAMAAAGNEAPLNEVASRMRSEPSRQVPTANSFITGRQTAS